MTQGETVEELEKNIKDAYHMMIMDDVLTDHQENQLRYEVEIEKF